MEYQQLIFIILLAIVVLVIATQFHGSDSEQSNEEYTYEMPLETVKAALDKILIEPIKVLQEERFWGPGEVVATGDGQLTLRYTIYYETRSLPTETGQDERSLNRLTLKVNVREKDKTSSLVKFAFEDQAVGLFAENPCGFIVAETQSRLTQKLAQLSVQRKGY